MQGKKGKEEARRKEGGEGEVGEILRKHQIKEDNERKQEIH